jgi:hypothetical protein
MRARRDNQAAVAFFHRHRTTSTPYTGGINTSCFLLPSTSPKHEGTTPTKIDEALDNDLTFMMAGNLVI